MLWKVNFENIQTKIWFVNLCHFFHVSFLFVLRCTNVSTKKYCQYGQRGDVIHIWNWLESDGTWAAPRPVARIDFFWGGADPKKVDLLDPKSGLFEPHPLNPPTKNPFLAHFVAKVDLLADLGGVLHPPGYGPGHTKQIGGGIW